MKKDCLASSTLSSTSLKGTLTKIQSRKHEAREKLLAHSSEDTEEDCTTCRYHFNHFNHFKKSFQDTHDLLIYKESRLIYVHLLYNVLYIFYYIILYYIILLHSLSLPSCSCSSCSRTVRRILLACIISFFALFCSVAMDFSSSLDRWQMTEKCLSELTSCRIQATLRIITDLQTVRNSCSSSINRLTPEVFELSAISHTCTRVEMDGLGQPCGAELAEFCDRLHSDVFEFVSVMWGDDPTCSNGTWIFTPAIEKILDLSGIRDVDIGLLKHSVDWTDMITLRFLVMFQELSQQWILTEGGPDIQFKWLQTLTTLMVLQDLSENFQSCWMENVDQELKLKDFSLNNPGSSFEGAQMFILALRNIQSCFLMRTTSALKLKFRDVSSSMSLKICLLTIACLIYPIVLLSFKQMTGWIQDYAQTLKEKTEDLKIQRKLAEDLLHQMLPKTVAKQLRKNRHVEAESYESVSNS